jgi:hypothetical protein
VTAVESSQALRHKQQRLILLQHAAQCQHKDGPCPVTRHCADMKQLWVAHFGVWQTGVQGAALLEFQVYP